MPDVRRFVKRLVGSRAGFAACAVTRSTGCFVLTYHRVGSNPYGFKNVSADVFRGQMRWLREHCTPIHPGELREQAATGSRWKPPVLVTFDDAYRDYYEVAYPILRELHIPAINFVSTWFADNGGLFWWDLVDLAVTAASRDTITLPWEPDTTIALTTAGRSALKLAVRHRVRSRPDAERDATVNGLLDALDVRRSDLHCERQVMTWDEMRQVTELTLIGGHTHSHPLMSRVDNDALHEETRLCRSRIEAELAFTPTTFAYPGGAFTAEAKDVLRQHGFDTAFTSIQAINNGSTDWMAVSRLHAPASVEQLSFVLSGLWSDRRRPVH